MGASASHPSQDQSGAPNRALHVLRVTPGSPASATDIEPFFDFIVGVDGDLGSNDKGIQVHNLERIVESHEGRTLTLIVWSSKYQENRFVPIVPSRTWSSPFAGHSHSRNNSLSEDPSKPRQPSLLGLSMRLCEPELSLDSVWHILEVLEGSPAESAGLVPYGDWVVGWSGGVLHGENDLLEVVEAHVDKPLRVYVYSYDFDTLREVVLVPNRVWGGDGLLGCGVGFGLLHRIPRVRRDQSAFDTNGGEAEYYAPQTPGFNLGPDSGTAYESDLFVPADDIYDDDEEVNDGIVPAQQDPHQHHDHSHEPSKTNGNHSHHHQYPPIPDAPPVSQSTSPSISKTSPPPPPRVTKSSPPPANADSDPESEPERAPTPLAHRRPSVQPRPSHDRKPSGLRGPFGGWPARTVTMSPSGTLRRGTPPPVLNRHLSDDDDDEDGSEDGRERATTGSMTSIDD